MCARVSRLMLHARNDSNMQLLFRVHNLTSTCMYCAASLIYSVCSVYIYVQGCPFACELFRARYVAA